MRISSRQFVVLFVLVVLISATLAFVGYRRTVPKFLVKNFSRSSAASPAPAKLNAIVITPPSTEISVGKSKKKRKLAAPLDPLLVATKGGANSELVAWVQNWQTNWVKGKELGVGEKQELAEVLQHTSLSTDDWFQIAHGFHHKYLEHVASSLLYMHAAKAADQSLISASTDAERLKVLHEIRTAHEDFKDVLWPLIEAKSDGAEALNTLTLLYSDMVRYCPSNDKSLASTLQTIKTGLAECLEENDDLDGALKLIEENSLEGPLPGERQAALDWEWGIILYRKNNFEDAIPHIEAVVNDPRFTYRKDASLLLVTLYARTGRKDKAERQCELYKQELAVK